MHTKNHTDMMYASWDMECHRHNFLSFWVIFCPFTPLLMPKIKMWKKYLKIQEILSFYKMCTMNEDHMMYDFRDIRCNKHSFLVILGHFLLFNPPNNPKNQNFEKIKKKKCKVIIILQLRNTNDNHLMYGSWDMECDRQNFLWFWDIFYPFTPLTTKKIKILKKYKKHLKILSFYTCLPQMKIILYMAPKI